MSNKINQSFLDRLEEIVNANLSDEQFGVEDLAKEVSMSRFQILRKIRNNSGQSVSQFIREVRLKRAKELLKNDEGTVSEIAYRVGFGSPTYFNKCFSEYYGFTPGEAKNIKIPEINYPEAKNDVVHKNKTKYKNPYYIIAGIVVVSFAILFIWKSVPTIKAVKIEKSIAVLPIKYLSSDQNKQYLADGVMNAIIGHLSKIDSLIVRPRTSVERYRNTDKSMQVIGKELGVSYLIEGSFLMVENQVKLTIQLINVKDDNHMFFKEYDRDYSDIIAVQSEVAQTIAGEISMNITPETKKIIETDPTHDLTAYDYYLKGKDYEHRGTDEEDLRYAIQMYQKAVSIDSTFVLAWIGLASAHRNIYWQHFYGNEELLLKTKEYIDYAKSLSPKLKEVLFEEGSYYYQCKLDYPKALQILEPLNSKYPNDEEIYAMVGFVYRRMGNFKKSLEYNNIAISSNPSNYLLWLNAGITLRVLRRYADAEKYFKKAIELNPSFHGSYFNLIKLYTETGQLKVAREFLINNPRIMEEPDIKLSQANIEVLDKNYNKAIQIIESLPEDVVRTQEYYQTKNLQLGLIYYMISNKEMAFKYFESEKAFLLSKIDIVKNDDRVYISLGIAFAGLGMKKEAIEAGEKALEIRSFSNDKHGGFDPEMAMVKILLMVGEYEDAIIRLENIISQNGNLTANELKIDPFWNPVREMEGFKAIINIPEYQADFKSN